MLQAISSFYNWCELRVNELLKYDMKNKAIKKAFRILLLLHVLFNVWLLRRMHCKN